MLDCFDWSPFQQWKWNTLQFNEPACGVYCGRKPTETETSHE